MVYLEMVCLGEDNEIHAAVDRVCVMPAQRVETDALMSEAHFAAHASMRPMWIDIIGRSVRLTLIFKRTINADTSPFIDQ